MIRKIFYSLLFVVSTFSVVACTSADKTACIQGNDKAAWQACNRECVRDDKEACAKAKVMELEGKNQ